MRVPTSQTLMERVRAFLAHAMQKPSDDDGFTMTYEQRALRLLQREGALDVATLIDRVADEAMHAAKIEGGAALDIAVWGPSIFHVEAAEAIRGMIGRVLILESDGPWLLLVPATRSLYGPPGRGVTSIASAMA